MAGLCEDGNEPPSSLKAMKFVFKTLVVHTCEVTIDFDDIINASSVKKVPRKYLEFTSKMYRSSSTEVPQEDTHIQTQTYDKCTE
ncbi:hypothetical protein ANN_07544 [Periplaneta americana]|uniref:Uncharacterized protein n=1 Tax=Periplaneta americana TaxID=6978 RepID=A0ABQ8SYZ6_PERAM|nr:hypothetical protein ANN_07544 [Periplaneta americana]